MTTDVHVSELERDDWGNPIIPVGVTVNLGTFPYGRKRDPMRDGLSLTEAECLTGPVLGLVMLDEDPGYVSP